MGKVVVFSKQRIDRIAGVPASKLQQAFSTQMHRLSLVKLVVGFVEIALSDRHFLRLRVHKSLSVICILVSIQNCQSSTYPSYLLPHVITRSIDQYMQFCSHPFLLPPVLSPPIPFPLKLCVAISLYQ